MHKHEEVRLSFDLAIDDYHDAFIDGGGLDREGPSNQQFRVHVISPPPTDPFIYVGPNVINLFATALGSSNFG